ncbi:OmpH family outer membrane protein [Silvibacterium acidisoli]|uniref:OmpH family outer membrane protein n=1 Tax=Acidobacteriaceae bacterium ZG23-2 TaxID=2883246 RepID=UPI00406CC171
MTLMKWFSTIAIGFVLIPALAQGQTAGTLAPAQASLVKVATVNFSAAVLATGEARHDLAALQSKYAPREAELQRLNDAVEAQKKQLSAAENQLSDSERNNKAEDLSNKEKQLQREAEDFRNDSQSDSQKVFQRVAQRLYPLLQDYSRQHGYSLVVERGSDANPIVWYADNGIDITELVAKAYDAKFGKTALPDSPATTAPSGSSKTPHRD